MWALFTALAAPPPLDPVVFVEQGSSACAGTVIDPDGTVLTAYHCVVHGGRVRVHTRDGRRGTGRVRAIDRRRDLALVAVPQLAGGPSLGVSARSPQPGEPVRAVGHPLGAVPPGGFFAGTLRWAVSGGEVAALGDRAVQITAPVNPGNSGGPVLDAEDAVVGVVSRRLGGDGLGFAGRVDEVEALLDRPARRMGLGGTVGVELLAQANGQLGIPFALGGRVELALRDRVVVSGAAALPVGARWEAVQLGEVLHQPGELRVALRQRIGHGPWTLRAEGWAGVGAIERIEADGVALTRSTQSAPLVGGRVGIRGIGIDYGVALGPTRFARLQISARWPGTLFVL